MKDVPYILIVDTDLNYAETICAQFKRSGCLRVLITDCFEEARVWVKDEAPQVILMEAGLHQDFDGMSFVSDVGQPVMFHSKDADCEALHEHVKKMELLAMDKSLQLVDYARKFKTIYHLALQRVEDPEACVRAYLETGMSLFGFNSGFVMHAHNGIVHRWACESHLGGYCPPEFEMEPGFIGSDVHLRKEMLLYHPEASICPPDNLSDFKDAGIHTYVGVPLMVQGRVYGSLAFCETFGRIASFSEQELELVELIADAIGRVIAMVPDPSLKG
jgi:hypothetical protein